ncbi:MAG TPA: lysophospholipid acyltransferase family protein [Candidatus Saccharimonadales bacterium]|nr:lysophospholipid acyltransferase family protein [Candidatus Saccharimonadales bacterium]
MLRIVFHAVLLALYTLLLGVPAILFLILIPTGDPLLWFARPWAWLIARSFGTRVEARGTERIPRGQACVFMSNHQSHFDLIALVLALPAQYRILAKKALFRIPVFGWALWLAGFIPIDRSDRERAIASIDRAVASVRRGRSVVIFAEGTRSPDGTLQPLKKGGFHLALQSGAPIVPVSIRGGVRVLPRGSLHIRPGRMEVVFGQPIPVEGRDVDSMDALMAEVRASLLAGLGDQESTPAGI